MNRCPCLKLESCCALKRSSTLALRFEDRGTVAVHPDSIFSSSIYICIESITALLVDVKTLKKSTKKPTPEPRVAQIGFSS